VWQADAVRHQRSDQAARAAGEDQLLGHAERLDRAAAAAADRLVEAEPEQTGLRGRGVQRQRQRALVLPAREVQHHLALGKAAGRRPQRT